MTFAPSDPARYDSVQVGTNDLSSGIGASRSAPTDRPPGGFLVSGGVVTASKFGGKGRPAGSETRRRTARFISLLADNVTLYDAIVQSGIQPLRAVRLFCQPDFQVIVNAVRVSGGQVTVVVDTEAAA